MAPKSILLTAGSPKPKKPYTPRKPLTTQGQILRAIAIKEKKARNQPREAPAGSENALGTAMADDDDDDDDAKPKKSKARSFAPPDETDYLAEELKQRNLAKARGNKKEGWSLRKKPLTTQQKIAAAIAVKRAKGGVANTAPNVPVAKWGKRETPGLISILKQHDKEFLPMTKEGREKGEGGGAALSWNDIKTAEDMRREKREEERLRSVLFRPTLRARKWRALHGVKEWPVKKDDGSKTIKDSKENAAGQGEKTQPPETGREGEKAAAKSKFTAGWFTGLPKENRNRLWRLVVIDDKSCVWPTSPTGREQPDLAMTCTQIRREVLPIYYGLNTFGISLQKEPMSADSAQTFQKKKNALTGLAAIRKWASIINNENVAWLSMIRNWAFEYQDPALGWGQRAMVDDDNSFVISMRIKPIVRQDRLEREEDLGEPEGGGEVRQSVSTADVEVHLEASCFMRGWSDCGNCQVQETPIELAAAVMWMLEVGVSANTLYKVANELRGMLRTLTRARCARS